MDTLINKNRQLWLKSVSHPLTNELCAGQLPLLKLYIYMKQDVKFFDHFVRLLAKTISVNDHDAEINVLLGKQIGFVCLDESTYFQDVLKELKLNHLSHISFDKLDTMTFQSVLAYNKFMGESCSSATITYAELVTVLAVMEQSYLEWANKGLQIRPKDLTWWYDDWIKLHSGEDFEKWCSLLASQVDRCYEIESNREKMDRIFIKAVEFEIGFFDDCYNDVYTPQ